MNKCFPGSVRNTEEQHFLRSSLHYSKHPWTFQYSSSLILLLAPNFDSSISTIFPKPPSLIPAFRTLLEQIVLSSLSAWITVGFERPVSRTILLPEICIAQRNIRCSQVLNGTLDPSKKEPDLIESHVRHRLFVQRHMYPSFTHVVQSIMKLGSSVDLVRIKLFLI